MTNRDFPWRLFVSMALLCLAFYAVCMIYPQGPRSVISRLPPSRTPIRAEFGARIVDIRQQTGGRGEACVVVETDAHDYAGGVQWLIARRLVATAADGTVRELWRGNMLAGLANPVVKEHVEVQGSRRVATCCFQLRSLPAAYGQIAFHWDARAWPSSAPGCRDVSLADLNRDAHGGTRLARTLILRR